MSRAGQLLRILTAPLRALGKASMRFSGEVGGIGRLIRFARSRRNYAAEVGDGRASSVVMAPVNWMARTFPEAPIEVVKRTDTGEFEPIIDHPMVMRIENPNPFYSGIVLWMATISDFAIKGNGYWLKLRNAEGTILEIWWAPEWTMEPKWSKDGSDYISHYDYKPDASHRAERWEPEDVVHFRWGLDPQNSRKGLGPIMSVLREIFTDDEAANFSASLLANMAVPGVILSPKSAEQGGFTEADTEEMKEVFVGKFGGDKRGEPMVSTEPIDVETVSFSPEQLALKLMRRIPEERVCAVLGIPAIVAGLGAGLDRSTYENASTLVEFAYEANTIPTQRLIAADLTRQLLPDYGAELGQERVRFDNTNVRALQDDRFAVWKQANDSLKVGALMLSEFKRLVGLPTGDADDYYLRPFAAVVVPLAEAGAPALPPPPPVAGPGKARRKGLSYQAAMERLRALQGRRLTKTLAAFFEVQAKRVVARIGSKAALVPAGANGSKAHYDFTPDSLLPASERKALGEAMGPGQAGGIEGGWTTTADAFGFAVAFDVSNPYVIPAISGAAERVRLVHEATKAAIREAMLAAEAAGYGPFELARGVEADGFRGLDSVVAETYLNRSQAIARTEMMWTTNKGAVALYHEMGVTDVQMIDGVDDPVCAARNGRTVAIAEGDAEVDQEHPNGTLVLTPVVRRE